MATSDDARVGWIEPVAPPRLPHADGTVGTTFCSADGVYTFVSCSAGAVLGWGPAELTGRSADDFLHPEDLATAQLARLAALNSTGAVPGLHRFRTKSGDYEWVETTTERVSDRGGPSGVLLAVTVRSAAGHKLFERRDQWALTDPLTGIAPRTVFMDRLTQALNRLDRHKSVVAVLDLDLDSFRAINESRGHEVAEQLLTMVAERVLRSLRLTDTLARIGGDEFVVLAEGFADTSQATRLAQAICRRIEEPFQIGGDRITCTVSAGVATTGDCSHGAETLLREADLALYRAKDQGRHRAELFDVGGLGGTGADDTVRRTRRGAAVAEERLRIDYQPIVDLGTGQLVSFEPRARIDGSGGLDFPETFVEVADDTGRLVDIDEWVFARAVEQARGWRRHLGVEGFRGIAINVPDRPLAGSHFCQVVGEDVGDQIPFEGESESEEPVRAAMDVFRSETEGLEIVRAVGVDVGPDDMGACRCSLSFLHRFPLDFVKIDSTAPAAEVAAVIRLAHALHLAVVAEGIESEDQIPILRKLGFDRGQGRLFGEAQRFSESAA